jgi:hypothetical protein
MSEQAKRFILHSPTRDLEQFKAFAIEAARLKPYGQVVVNISEIAEKGFHEIPEGGSGWHEYAVNSPGLHRVFPHPKIAPHVPADFVKANQKLLLDKAKVLQELGLDAGYWGVEPYFIVESFWREFPHLRGPRVDHPRRSTQEEFSICVDHPESREIISWMAAELRKAVPNFGTFVFKTNDAGGSMCWANALYPGIQGPAGCQSLSPGQHVANFVSALHEGFETGGGDVPVYIGHCNFWGNEIYDIQRLLPANTFLAAMDSSTMAFGSMISGAYPIRGMINPAEILAKLERFHKPQIKTVFVDFRSSYDRANETPETTARVLDVFEHGAQNPTSSLLGRLNSLKAFAAKWAGENNAEALMEALVDLDNAFKLRSAITGRGFSTLYAGVSLRHITRPFVIRPELLTEDEESYFLPHIFNVDRGEARKDYIDLHGGRMSGPVNGMPPGWNQALSKMLDVAGRLEAMADAEGQGKFLFKLATAVRIYVSVNRSAVNFYFGQTIRDQYADRLAGEPLPVKLVPGGTADLMKWNDLMRAEMQNTEQLIALLKERGTEQIVIAPDSKHEDTFVLGPDLLDQLKRKIDITRKYWLDAEHFLQPPAK